MALLVKILEHSHRIVLGWSWPSFRIPSRHALVISVGLTLTFRYVFKKSTTCSFVFTTCASGSASGIPEKRSLKGWSLSSEVSQFREDGIIWFDLFLVGMVTGVLVHVGVSEVIFSASLLFSSSFSAFNLWFSFFSSLFSVFSRSVIDSFSLILWNLSFIFFVYVCIRSMPDLFLFCNACLMSGSFSHFRKMALSIVVMLAEPTCKQWPFSKLPTCAVLNPLFTEKRIW